MLSKEENELLTRTGPGTPMGRLMRCFWTPAMTEAEVPGPDEAPVRLQLLGENLVVFRDTEGRVGVLDQHCPHRCASLFFGRNEEGGVRCVYHGWIAASAGLFNTVQWALADLALAGLRRFWHDLARDLFDDYRPERHYMRGPGPKWHAKHGLPAAASAT